MTDRLRIPSVVQLPPVVDIHDEVIDLTVDSPVVYPPPPQQRSRIRNRTEYPRIDDNLPGPYTIRQPPHVRDPYYSIGLPDFPVQRPLDLNDTGIQILENDDPPVFLDPFILEEALRVLGNGDTSIEESSTAIPYLNDSSTGERTELSCPICFEPLIAKQRPMATLCGHVYCTGCLKEAVRRSKTCPKCTAPVRFRSCIRLYF